MTPFVWTNAVRTEIVTTGHGLVISYDLDGKELWRIGGMAIADSVAIGMGRAPLCRHRLAGRRQPSVPGGQAGRVR